MEMSAGKLWSMRRLSSPDGFFMMNAVDQRPAVEALVAECVGRDVATYDEIGALKKTLIELLSSSGTAIQVDPDYGYPYGYGSLDPSRGLIVAAEAGTCDEDQGGRRNFLNPGWSVEKIKRLGADAVKVTVWYRPEASPDTLRHQREFVEAIGRECRRHDIAFLICPMAYAFPGEVNPDQWEPHKQPAILEETLCELRKERYGLDLFQLENPIRNRDLVDPDDGSAASANVQSAYNRIDSLLDRPWVMMSAGAGRDAYRRTLTFAFRAGASGYLAGRVMWGEAAKRFPDIGGVRAALRGHDTERYIEDIQTLLRKCGKSWHRKLAPSGDMRMAHARASFKSEYPAF
ncbi:tagatose 1,6-diphosphate aldolase [Sinorhizobium mexicanum]|uniref:Tagatose 1,6-diphosphate aldolase n=1 Tax=Sinorhizobium mexicanum TaxID=375549 RepID=A0A859QJR6_9HYPH|nr:tagatose 1,6-diphosphate aldolase [Sinorhizobium mexicanum]MBP1881759.1 tagatose 1,6-diphosphate aldolase [Sinorhizobium mexicanum]QLL61517.1 tagatose 1,6-diphosphate aldolase [Sinorhizobium mexicanum]